MNWHGHACRDGINVAFIDATPERFEMGSVFDQTVFMIMLRPFGEAHGIVIRGVALLITVGEMGRM
jgi:hypothetical protein